MITVSDRRTVATDEAGDLAVKLIGAAGYRLGARSLLPNDGAAVRRAVESLCATPGTDAVVITGGTGVGPRDVTVDAVAPLFDRQLDGYGELFRTLSFQEIGSAAMLSRAAAGVRGKVAIFTTPGSPAGLRLALERLILPELAHLIGQLRGPGAATGGDRNSASPEVPSAEVTGPHAPHRNHGHHRH